MGTEPQSVYRRLCVRVCVTESQDCVVESVLQRGCVYDRVCFVCAIVYVCSCTGRVTVGVCVGVYLLTKCRRHGCQDEKAPSHRGHRENRIPSEVDTDGPLSEKRSRCPLVVVLRLVLPVVGDRTSFSWVVVSTGVSCRRNP